MYIIVSKSQVARFSAYAFEIGQMAQAAVEKALQIGQRLWRMKSDLKRKES